MAQRRGLCGVLASLTVCTITITTTTHATLVAHPPSTLLPAGTTSINLVVTTTSAPATAPVSYSAAAHHRVARMSQRTTLPTVATTHGDDHKTMHDGMLSCKYGPSNVSFTALPHTMTAINSSAASTTLSVETTSPTVLFIRCENDPSVLYVGYRTVPNVDQQPFPRIGNLWGSGNFMNKPLEYAASRIDMWLGADWNATQAATLRQLNPWTIALTSINACEGPDGLPEEYYLHNITRPPSTKGRLCSWPGAYRLDLTNPIVQQYQANQMYQLVTRGGSEGSAHTEAEITMLFDGIFVDNVFLTQSWANHDIYGNPFYPDTTGTGKPDNPQDFDRRWRAGIAAELTAFRAVMPHALMSGHAMSVNDPLISSIFNAISIGFTSPDMIEGVTPVSEGVQDYHDWMTIPTHSPHITMIESAVRLQLGYGYGFDTQISKRGQPGYMPVATYDFARSEYQYMRFGYGYTLMEDGFYTHEMGDSAHGQDWRYDEEDFVLGLPKGSAYRVALPPPPSPPLPPPVVLDPHASGIWFGPGNNGTLSLDTQDVPPGITPAISSTITITTLTNPGGISFVDYSHRSLTITAGVQYQLTYWAKSSITTKPIGLNSRLDHDPWTSTGLDDSTQQLTTDWARYTVNFTGSLSTNESQVSWFLGVQAGVTFHIAGMVLTSLPPLAPYVMRRDFDCGSVIWNADVHPHNVPVDATALQHIPGTQAPLHQYIVDDHATTSFTAVKGNWTEHQFAHGYSFSEPSQESDFPPYWHHFEKGAHTASQGAVGQFTLDIPEAGNYNLSIWWPAATSLQSNWSSQMDVATVCPTTSTTSSSVTTTMAAPTSVDLRSGGDAFALVAHMVALSPGCNLTLTCVGIGTCVADAVLVSSEARYNNGADIEGETVSVGAMDGMVLAVKGGKPCTSY
eukprot:m.45135 g.45135  ORF g.45135 m.45135 type:complete len:908 (-) comp6618_c0_seq1:148-2871(-)